MDLILPEVLAGVAELQQHRISDGLTREGRASCPESDRHTMLPGNGQDPCDLLLRMHLGSSRGLMHTLQHKFIK